MAKQKFKLNSNIFIDEYEKEIELSTKRNLDRLKSRLFGKNDLSTLSPFRKSKN